MPEDDKLTDRQKLESLLEYLKTQRTSAKTLLASLEVSAVEHPEDTGILAACKAALKGRINELDYTLGANRPWALSV